MYSPRLNLLPEPETPVFRVQEGNEGPESFKGTSLIRKHRQVVEAQLEHRYRALSFFFFFIIFGPRVE